MASPQPDRVALLVWGLLALMGVINLVEGDVLKGVALTIAGSCLVARELVSDEKGATHRWLSGMGGVAAVLALTTTALGWFL